jgi:predicted PurR-regulated permease PerM
METKGVNNLNKTIFMIVIVLFGVLLVYSLKEYFTAFLGSVTFYVLFKRWMEYLSGKRKWKKSRAALLIIAISFFIVLIPVFFFFSMIYKKVAPVINHPQELFSYIKHIDANLYEKFGIEIFTDKNIQEMQATGSDIASGIVNEGLALFASITMMYFFLYFLLVNYNRMEASILVSLPFSNSKIKMFGSELRSQTFSNAIGIPLIALIQGIFAFGAYYFTGLPEAAFWAILTGFSSVIPIVGTAIIWLPAALYFFAVGDIWQGVVIIAWCALVMGSMDNVIRFVLAKKMADVHPVVTVLGIIFGLHYLGITGLIFGPLIISYFLILLKIYNAEYQNLTLKKKKEAVLEIGVPFIYTKKFKQKDDEK